MKYARFIFKIVCHVKATLDEYQPVLRSEPIISRTFLLVANYHPNHGSENKHASGVYTHEDGKLEHWRVNKSLYIGLSENRARGGIYRSIGVLLINMETTGYICSRLRSWYCMLASYWLAKVGK